VALIDHLQVVTEMGAASATPDSRFERLTNLKPPALPGILTRSITFHPIPMRAPLRMSLIFDRCGAPHSRWKRPFDRPPPSAITGAS
jgi:hypothetical protein